MIPIYVYYLSSILMLSSHFPLNIKENLGHSAHWSVGSLNPGVGWKPESSNTPSTPQNHKAKRVRHVMIMAKKKDIHKLQIRRLLWNLPMTNAIEMRRDLLHWFLLPLKCCWSEWEGCCSETWGATWWWEILIVIGFSLLILLPLSLFCKYCRMSCFNVPNYWSWNVHLWYHSLFY